MPLPPQTHWRCRRRRRHCLLANGLLVCADTRVIDDVVAFQGLSNIMRDGDFLKTSCGSPNYAAPEVISGKLYAGPEVDVWSCGVTLYVLLCGKLPFDEDHVPSLFKKIRGGIFTLPSHLSEGTKDLISGMLLVDQATRLKIRQIRDHPWVDVEMPDYLFPGEGVGAGLDPGAGYDEKAIAEICVTFKVKPDKVRELLLGGDPSNQICLAYSLIMSNRWIAAQGHRLNPEEGELTGADFLKRDYASPPRILDLKQRAPASPSFQPTRPQSPATTYRSESPSSPVRTMAGPSGSESEGSSVYGSGPASNHRTRAFNLNSKGKQSVRWHLGMRSQNTPQEVMGEVYRAMAALSFQWKIVTPYHIRCRSWNQVSGSLLKMSLQLYKLNDGSHLLDLKALPSRTSEGLTVIGSEGLDDSFTSHGSQEGEGDWKDPHTLEFFELCATIVQELSK